MSAWALKIEFKREESRLYLVCVELELSLQNGIGDVVDKISSAHPAIITQKIEAKATIGIIWVPNRTCSRIDDAL